MIIMIYVSEAYKNACDSSERKSYIVAKYGQFDKSIKGEISKFSSSGSSSFSNEYKAYNDIKETNYNYITCEPNRVRLDNSFFFISNKNQPNTNENIALFSKDITNASGNFDSVSFSFHIYFNRKVAMTDLVLHFQEVCSKFRVVFFDDNQSVYEKTIDNNIEKSVQVVIPSNYLSYFFNRISIIVYTTKEPYRYVKFNEIDFGNFRTFTNDEIVDLNVIDELSIDSSELSSNYLSLTLDDTKQEYNILNPNNKLSFIQEKQEITIYHYLKVVNQYKEIPLGTFLVKDFKVGNNKLQIEAYDDTYFMNKVYYGSKFYNNIPITQIFKDLFNYFDYTNYIIDDELNEITLTGYVPNVQFREALRLIAEASCSVINKTRYGKTYIFKTYDTSVKTFTKRLQFKENHEKNLFNNVIDVNEYSYKAIENQEVYNSNLDIGEHTIILKKYPVLENTIVKSDTSNNNYEIISSSSTSCIVNVINETDVILNATLMEQSNIVKRVKKQQIEQDEFAISEIRNTLITSSNSSEVANWKLNRGNIVYNFDTIITPYIEVGDTCKYQTQFGNTNEFIPTRIEYDKSFIQHIEGE